MKFRTLFCIGLLAVIAAFGVSSEAAVQVQCPGDTNGDALWTGGEVQPANTACLHLAAGDGFINMADGHLQYIFGFSDVTGELPANVMTTGLLAAQFPGPTVKVKEGDSVYLTLSNVGMVLRPDLFDPHSVHFHGFPNASTIFDGEPMASLAINMGAPDLLLQGARAGHVHVPLPRGGHRAHADGHARQSLGTPLQDGTNPGANCPSMTYVYNDGDGSTCYDVEFPVQIHAFDSVFHDLHIAVQPLPFALMKDNYPMLNGRGYPDTINTAALTPPADNGGKISQSVHSLIEATSGQKILLRISSLSTVDYYTLTVLGIPMKVVGKDARILRSSTGVNLAYMTNSVTLGGGETYDVILNTAGVPPGTYFLYAADLNSLNNDGQDYGGMMTEIHINRRYCAPKYGGPFDRRIVKTGIGESAGGLGQNKRQHGCLGPKRGGAYEKIIRKSKVAGLGHHGCALDGAADRARRDRRHHGTHIQPFREERLHQHG
jgi:FtsP/CotA-like multicopper oxidase with cupredoxin domain